MCAGWQPVQTFARRRKWSPQKGSTMTQHQLETVLYLFISYRIVMWSWVLCAVSISVQERSCGCTTDNPQLWLQFPCSGSFGLRWGGLRGWPALIGLHVFFCTDLTCMFGLH